jgi:hypothetical protein
MTETFVEVANEVLLIPLLYYANPVHNKIKDDDK